MKRKTRTYGVKFIRECVALYKEGRTIEEVCRLRSVPDRTLRDWLKRYEARRTMSEAQRLRYAKRAAGPNELVQRALFLYDRGLSCAEVGHILSCHKGTVGRWIRRWGTPRPSGGTLSGAYDNPNTPRGRAMIERVRQASQMKAEGVPVREIAACMGVTGSAVYRWLNSKHNPYRIDAETQARAIASAAERRGTERANGRRAA